MEFGSGVCHCDSSLLNHGHLCADRDDCHIGENTSSPPLGAQKLCLAVITLLRDLKGIILKPGKPTSTLDHLLALHSLVALGQTLSVVTLGVPGR